MKLATTTADFRGYAATPAETVRLFAGTGFTLLDLNLYRENAPGSPWLAEGEDWKRLISDAGEAAADQGIRFCQAHAPDGEHFIPGPARDNLLRCTRHAIEACAMLGIPNLVAHAAGSPEFTPRQFLGRNRDFFAEFFDDLDRHGVNLLIENSAERNAPHYYLRTGAELREFLEFAGHPRLHACWDTGHAHLRGMDQYRSLLELGPELRGLHVADNYGDADSHTAPFFGTCNFDPVLQGLVDIGYKGAFTFEGGSLMRNHDVWPNFRKPWEHQGRKVTTLLDVPLHLKRRAVALMYEVGRHMLEAYGCFEG
jgi:sugar phosphate isomerase/epimerase